MDHRELAPYMPPATIPRNSMGILTSIFFSPETTAQIRLKRITFLRKNIPRLACEAERARSAFKDARKYYGDAKAKLNTIEQNYSSQYCLLLLNATKIRSQVLEHLQDNMGAHGSLTGEAREEYKESTLESLDLIHGLFQNFYPSGKNNPKVILGNLEKDLNAAQIQHDLKLSIRNDAENKFGQALKELTDKKEELARLESSVAQLAATADVSSLVDEFD